MSLYMSLFLLVVCLISASLAFTAPDKPHRLSTTSTRHISITTTRLYAEGTGGWGLSNSRHMVPEEFASKRGGERKAFEGYKLSDRGEFMRQVSAAKDNQQSEALAELLGVAKQAGINVKNPRMNKFEPEVFGDVNDDGDDLDLSV
ncbi:hypothetical protein MPSEU_000307200 [Mayamaea pseudoterrestris]|nr:hypothetical protein MPSEU_000307200 [Mayamaea pseudoterrestris]